MGGPKRGCTPITRRIADAYQLVRSHPGLQEERLGPLLAEGRRRLEARRELWEASPSHHSDFAASFVNGQAFLSSRGEVLEATVREIGELVVTSGHIVACEPFCDSRWRRPLARTIPPGRYPVILSSVGGTIACAMLRVRDARPARWELATWPGQDPTKLGVSQLVCYSVDGGAGAFLDADQVRHLDESFPWPSRDYRVKTRRKDPIDGRWVVAICDPATGGNLFYFDSGYGDGAYASYWGLDGDGEPTCLVTDFRVLTEARDAAFSLPVELRRPPGEIRHSALDMAGLIMEVILGRSSGRSLVVGFLCLGASAVGATLWTEAGERLVTGDSPTVVEGDGVTFRFLELEVPKGRDPVWARLCVSLSLGSFPMQAVGPHSGG